MSAILLGITLALIAGLATAIGGAIVFLIKKERNWYLPFSLAFSVGVMITVSFAEMLLTGIESIGHTYALTLFFAGAIIAFIIDHFLPHEYIGEKVSKEKKFDPKLMKTGLFIALGLAIHNFPEGIAVFVGNLHSIEFGVLLTIAIAMHNIPEGIAVAMPIYFATKNKGKAFLISLFSGIAEPIGAVIALLILLPFLSHTVIGASIALVAGIMVYICFDELLPTCYKNCADENSHIITLAFLLGSIVMGATLIILG